MSKKNPLLVSFGIVFKRKAVRRGVEGSSSVFINAVFLIDSSTVFNLHDVGRIMKRLM